MTGPVYIESDGQWEHIGYTTEGVRFKQTEAELAHQRTEFRRNLAYARGRVRKLFPGPAGEVLYREMNSYDEFGYLFDGKPQLMVALVNQIKDMEIENAGTSESE